MDVYRKGIGTTRTSSTVSSITLTTSATYTTTYWSSEGPWQYVGPCSIQGDCMQTPEGGQGQCVLTLPKGTPVQVTQSSSFAGSFSINGVELHEENAGSRFVVDTAISWSSNASSLESAPWEVCIVGASCKDGLEVLPVPSADCPTDSADLPDCEAAQPGELCLGDGECLTYSGLNNCPPAAVYRKEMGSTRTVTATTSGTTTFTPSAWAVSGPCSVSGACAQSPNYPANYGSNERCELSLPEGSEITISAFETELNYDRLTINGQSFSGNGHAIIGKSVAVFEPILWRTDESKSAAGWQLCLSPPRLI